MRRKHLFSDGQCAVGHGRCLDLCVGKDSRAAIGLQGTGSPGTGNGIPRRRFFVYSVGCPYWQPGKDCPFTGAQRQCATVKHRQGFVQRDSGGIIPLTSERSIIGADLHVEYELLCRVSPLNSLLLQCEVGCQSAIFGAQLQEFTIFRQSKGYTVFGVGKGVTVRGRYFTQEIRTGSQSLNQQRPGLVGGISPWHAAAVGMVQIIYGIGQRRLRALLIFCQPHGSVGFG